MTGRETFAVAAVTLALLNGCAAAALTTDRSSYAPGETATIRLENRGLGSITYNLCLTSLEQNSSGTWQHVRTPDEPDACTLEAHILRAFGEDTVQRALPTDADGTFRFVTNVEVGGENRDLATDPFSISPPAR